MRTNQVMRHAFENLPQSVLSTPLGRVIFRTLQRQVTGGNPRKVTRGGKR